MTPNDIRESLGIQEIRQKSREKEIALIKSIKSEEMTNLFRECWGRQKQKKWSKTQKQVDHKEQLEKSNSRDIIRWKRAGKSIDDDLLVKSFELKPNH